MRKLLTLSLLIWFSAELFAQSTFVPYNRDYYHLIDRFQIKYGSQADFFQTTFKPLRRNDLSNFLGTVQEKYDSLSSQDRYNFEFLMNDNWEWTNSPYNENPKDWWSLAYERKSDFYAYKTDNFTLRLNPVFDFQVGNDPDEAATLYTNTRGLEAHGMIDKKIGFYTFLTTTQAAFPNYVYNLIEGPRRAFPNEGFWKTFGDRGWDFFHARGYITFNLTKSIDIQAGHDKQFIGNGIRSMILSDFSSPSLFLKMNTRVGPFQYTNLFSQLTEDIIFLGSGPGDGDYPKKFLAFHRLGLNFGKNVEVGVFESIVSNEANINYFNPLIFYRALELQEGSPDNVLLGLDFKVNIRDKFQVYGQAVIDEFRIDALRNETDDWRNKFGGQLGIKVIDAFDIPTLDLNLEWNAARPYLYASDFTETSYTNYRNPLAHPLGANLKEIGFIGRYQPINKLNLQMKVFRTTFGEDPNGQNFGGNPLLSVDTRSISDGVVIGQGIENKLTYVEWVGTYRLLHNLFVDLRGTYRKLDSQQAVRSSQTFITSLSLRWNLPQRQHEF